MIFIFQVILSFINDLLHVYNRCDYLIKQFLLQSSAISFTSDEKEQSLLQVHFTLPTWLKWTFHS